MKIVAMFLFLQVYSLSCLQANAGCLEPQIVVGEGNFIVESCNFRTTSNLLYEDPRGHSAKSITSVLATDKKMGAPKIHTLPEKMIGVVIRGKFENKDQIIEAFLRTSKSDYCNRFEKSRTLKIKVAQECCDCNACLATPCSVGIRNIVLTESE